MSEPGDWDLSVQIEGLSLRIRGLRLGSAPASSSPNPPSPSSSLSSFTLVPARSELGTSLPRAHPALDLDLTVGAPPLHPSAASAQVGVSSSSSSSVPGVPEYPSQSSAPEPTRVHPAQAVDLDLAAGPNPEQPQRRLAVPLFPSAAAVPEYPSQGQVPLPTRVHPASVVLVPTAGPNPAQVPGKAPSPYPAAAAVPEYPLQGRRQAQTFLSRQEVALSFPPVPDFCKGICRSLGQGHPSADERAERAWLAGCWAGAVLEGLVDRPDPTPHIGLQSRFYCILRADGLTEPVVASSLTVFRRIIGRELGTSVSQGFPSISECRVYFAAAGRPYPATTVR